ncbi:MAG: hypothetical protein CM15mP126_3880 [Gammaproteobacteria bacterium]|nr:MAG: hypothetical protein CM15mP126_3880 [Gammaproteobacteria bacterium]
MEWQQQAIHWLSNSNFYSKKWWKCHRCSNSCKCCLGLVEPTGCGIGGDLFAIVWVEDDKKLYGLNASGPAPKNLNINYFKKNNLTVIPP